MPVMNFYILYKYTVLNGLSWNSWKWSFTLYAQTWFSFLTDLDEVAQSFTSAFLPATFSNSFCQQECHLRYYIFFCLLRWYLSHRNLDTGRETVQWKVIYCLLWMMLMPERNIVLKSQCVRWSCSCLVILKIRQKEFQIGRSNISKRPTVPSHHPLGLHLKR